MKVVALISGGKDSIYSIKKCLDYGHEVVCLANLAPEVPGDEELDSFCFQTVGHRHVEAIARALGLPLVRGAIARGTSRVTTMEYPARPDDADDEVERLRDLLAAVRAAHPEVAAVCTGAILSNYQRLRVESVCARLGLLSLGYLWQRNQDEYVAELAAEGYDVRLVKVASMGLKVQHLGQPLSLLAPKLAEMEYCHSAGEGGEYESIVVDCPLYRTALSIADPKVVRLNADDFAPVAHLEFRLEETPKTPREGRLAPKALPAPPSHAFADEDPVALRGAPPRAGRRWASACGRWRVYGGCAGAASEAEPLAEVAGRLLGAVEAREEAAFVHVYGREIAGFAAVNSGYNPQFGAKPPSRAFVEVRGQAADVTMDVLCCSLPRETLHVQSISEWAPACIGPYAQATTLGSTVLHAGMLGFDPPTMTLANPPQPCRTEAVSLQARRALQSYAAVMDVVGSGFARVGLGVAYVLHPDDFAAAGEAWRGRWGGAAVPDAAAAPPCLVVCVSALPKHAAYELQLMSTVNGAAPPVVSSDAGAATALFPEMGYAAAGVEAVAAAFAALEGAGYEVGHVKVFAQCDADADTAMAAVPEAVPVTILPSRGATLVLDGSEPGAARSMVLVWAAKRAE